MYSSSIDCSPTGAVFCQGRQSAAWSSGRAPGERGVLYKGIET